MCWRPGRLRGGELSEWPKEPDSKSGVPVRVPWVRIPRSPLRPRARGASRSALFVAFVAGAAPADEGGQRVRVEDGGSARERRGGNGRESVDGPAMHRFEGQRRRG